MGGWPSELNARTWIAEHRQKAKCSGREKGDTALYDEFTIFHEHS